MTEIKERPIIFSAPMVRAILAGNKSQTRRVVKPQPGESHWQLLPGYRLNVGKPVACIDGRVHVRFHHTIPQNPHWERAGDAACPHGQPGDILWVRETWTNVAVFHEGGGVVGYRAEARHAELYSDYRWRPSIHMPRWASRITLEITGVRVERLQDIHHNMDDLLAEGVRLPPSTLYPRINRPDKHEAVYQKLWESIHGPGSWEKNPLVWVIEFRRVEAK